MKYLYLSLILFLPFKTWTQQYISPNPLQTLESRISAEGIDISDFYSLADITINNANQIVYVTQYYPLFTANPNGLNNYDLVEGEYFKLTVMNTALDKIYEWKSREISNPTLYPVAVRYIENEEDHIELFGQGTNDTLQEGTPDFFIYTFDTTLELLEETWFNLSLPLDIAEVSSVIKNHDENYVMTGFLTTPEVTDPDERDIFFCEFTREGEIVKLTSPSRFIYLTWINANEIVQLDNGNYIVNPFYILDEDFNELAYYDDHNLILSGRLAPIDSTRFIFGGTGVVRVDNTINGLYNFESLCVGNTDGAIDTIFYNSVQNMFVQWMPGIKAISAVDTNHIYFATNRDGFFGAENTNVSLHSININGTTNWSYYFGGDASYTPIDIVTLPDGGCLVFVWKLFRDNPFEEWKADIDYVRFDVDGNLYDLTTSIKNPSFKVLSALVYPNPTSDELYIEHGDQLKDLRIEIVNASGVKVLSKAIDQESINLQSFSNGIYFYVLYEGNEFLQSGKVVVEK